MVLIVDALPRMFGIDWDQRSRRGSANNGSRTCWRPGWFRPLVGHAMILSGRSTDDLPQNFPRSKSRDASVRLRLQDAPFGRLKGGSSLCWPATVSRDLD